MPKVYKIAIFALIILGTIHCVFTPFIYKTFNADALWFFGTGLSYIFMGLYNLASIKVNIKSIFIIAVALNFIATLFSIAITYILRDPQAYVAMVLIIFIFLYSLTSVLGSLNK